MRFIVGVIVSSVALFFWGFVFWTLLPYPMSVFKDIPNQDALAQLLKETLSGDGVYRLPSGAPDNEESIERYRQGPIATLMYREAGGDPASTEMMVRGFVHMLGSTFLLALVLATAGRRTYMGRFLLAFWIGLFVAIWAEMSNVIWFHFPLSYACLQQTYHVTSIMLTGAILAFFIRPPGELESD